MISHIPQARLEGVKASLNIDDSAFKGFSFASGGCINHGGKLKTTLGDFFLKWNDIKKFPGMFEAESKGLNLLREKNNIRIPEVISFGESETHQFLHLEFIEEKFIH